MWREQRKCNALTCCQIISCEIIQTEENYIGQENKHTNLIFTTTHSQCRACRERGGVGKFREGGFDSTGGRYIMKPADYLRNNATLLVFVRWQCKQYASEAVVCPSRFINYLHAFPCHGSILLKPLFIDWNATKYSIKFYFQQYAKTQ